MGIVKYLILLSLFYLQEVTADNQTKYSFWSSECYNYTVEIYRSRLKEPRLYQCLGEKYSFGHQIEKFQDECSVEPDDKSLSYMDSVWTFYQCIVEKSLGGKPLTLANYVEMMAGNLSEGIKSSIISLVNDNEGQNESKAISSDQTEGKMSLNSTEAPKLMEIEKYWNSYFEAEFKVCTNSPANACNTSKEIRYLRYYWDPSVPCHKRRFPRELEIKDPKQKDIKACKTSLMESHSSLNWTSNLTSPLYFICTGVNMGFLEKDDLDKPIDFEILYNKTFIDTYQSASIKRFYKDFFGSYMWKRISKDKAIIKPENNKDILKYVVDYWENKLEVNKETNTEHRTFLTNIHVLNDVFTAGFDADYNVCYRSL